MANKKKTTTAIVAGVAATALLLGGTFAWTSISQQAKNESAGIVNVGGRLHDDFDGTNKDIYVENFTDPLNGGQPIYARIKLSEYMEVGQDAGGFGGDVDGDGVYGEAVPVVEGTDIDDPEGWAVHYFDENTVDPDQDSEDPEEDCDYCENGDTCLIHDHWEWTMGGGTTYMPTFNKDKDSLEPDINGTYAGTNDDDKIYYDDYVIYTTAENGVAVDMTDENFAPEDGTAQTPLTEAEGEVNTVTGMSQYDNDTDNLSNEDGVEDVNYVLKEETHTAKETAVGTVISMAEWIDNGKIPGDYWVYDTDGWAYWANPIMPGQATGLLLSKIEMLKNPGERCYYSIYVTAQFATVGDWEYFNGDDENPQFDGTENAEALLEAASQNVTTVTVTNGGATTLDNTSANGGVNTTTFTATASKAGAVATASADEFTWAVYDTNLSLVETSTTITPDENGGATLTIGEDEQNQNLIIAATHVESGAVGLASVAVSQADRTAPTVTVVEGETAFQTITISNIDDGDYPLTVKLYELTNEAEDYSVKEPTTTVTITNADDVVKYEPTNGMIRELISSENGDIVLTSNVTTSSGDSIYLLVTVTDHTGNENKSELLLVEPLVGCFAAGTQIQTVNGCVAIETIQVGDEVYSVDMTTGEKVVATVSWVQDVRFIDATYTICAGGEQIVATYEHPFYVADKGWTAAEDLEAGDKLLTGNGDEVVIDQIIYTPLDEPIQVYNFTVENTHTYLVGENSFLVHNVQK